MKNIDKELIDWSVNKIKTKYQEDVDLLIGRVGACKTPDDEQNMAFDFFIPATERGNLLAQTFIIEEMGYDLFPISWDRLQGIVDLMEPQMIFAFMRGEVIYARNKEVEERFIDMKQQLKENLEDKTLIFNKALES
ncbi:MAG: hypothetical protein Q4F97_12795, partial [Bacteroidales bacterium]|nr:hypothetical protein [Bacteroidales bacterium]